MKSRKGLRRDSVKTIAHSRLRAAAAAVPLPRALLESLENRCLLSAVVTTGAANSISATGATLNGTVNPQGGTVADTFQYSTSPGFTPTVTTTVGSGFNFPLGVAVDAAGDVFVGDTGNNAVKEITPDGHVKTLASGLNTPHGVAVDAAGDVFVADLNNNAVKEILPGGGINIIGPGLFNQPTGVAVDAAGDVFVADYGHNAVKEITPGGLVKTLGSGFVNKPGDVAVDAAGDVFVADIGNNAVEEILPNGHVNTLGSGFKFKTPYALAVDAAGDVFIADIGNNAVEEILPDGITVITLASGFNQPAAVAVDAAGDVFVADAGNNRIVELSPPTVTATPMSLTGSTATATSGTLTGLIPNTTYYYRAVAQGTGGTVTGATGSFTTLPLPPSVTTGAAGSISTTGATLNGTVNPQGGTVADTFQYSTSPAFAPTVATAIGSGFSSPIGVAVDAAGDVFVADRGATTVTEILPDGITTNIIASGFHGPYGVAVDKAGNVFVADSGTGGADSGSIKEILAVGGAIPASPTIRTLGSGFAGPFGVAVDAAGDVFVADYGNNAVKEIVAVGGTIPDSPTIRTLDSGGTPAGVAVDAAGDLFVAYPYNTASHTTIKEFVAVGGTIPANPTIKIIGSGFSFPDGVAVDAAGDLFVAETGGGAVKEILPDGTILTLASGFNNPNGVAVDAAGNVFFADTNAGQVFKLSSPGITATPASLTGSTATATSGTLTGLTPNTTYYYRAVAKGAGGTVAGTTKSFTTLSIPTSLSLSTPAAATYGNATVGLSASVSASGTVNEGTVTFTITQGSTTLASVTGTVSNGLATATLPLAGFNAGTYTVTASYSDATNLYGVSSAGPASLVVNKATLTVTANNASKTYGGADPVLTDTVSGTLFHGDTASVVSGVVLATTTGAAATAGSHAITASGGTAANYNIVYVNGTLTVNKAAALTATANNASKTYGGADPTLTDTVTGTTYYGDVAQAVVTGVNLAAPTGALATAGLQVITATGGSAANYNVLDANGTLTVFKAAALTATADAKSKVYGAADPALTDTVSGTLFYGDTASVVSGVVLATTTGAAATAGTHAITASGGTASNYNVLDADGTLTVAKAAALTVTADAQNKVYGATDPTLTDTVTGTTYYGDVAQSLVSGVLLSTTTGAAATAGAHTILAAGGTAANYNVIDAIGTLTVAKAAALTATANNASKSYGDTDPTLSDTVTGTTYYGDVAQNIVTGVSLSTTTGSAATAGTHAIVATGGTAANYNVTDANGTLSVAKAAALTVTADNQSKVYGAADPALSDTVTGTTYYGDVAQSLVSGVSLSTTTGAAATAGTHAIVATGGTAANYNVTDANGTLTVAKAAALMATANNASKTYGDTDPTLSDTVTGTTYYGDVAQNIVTGVSLSTTTGSSATAGTHAITASGGTAANYNVIDANGTLTVAKAAALTVTADAQSKIYGATDPTLSDTVTGTTYYGDVGQSVVSGVILSTTTGAAATAGTHAIVATGGTAANYNVTDASGILTVSKAAPLTVTADNQSKVYGAADPTLTDTVTGTTYYGDVAQSLVSGVLLSTTTGAAATAGTHAITASGGTAANYNVTDANGTLTVAKAAALTVTADDQSKVYGATDPTLTDTVTGTTYYGDVAQNVVSTVTLSTTTGALATAGTHAITATGGIAANYNIVDVNGTLTVAQAHLSVVANPGAKTYGQTATESGTVSGVQYSDAITAAFSSLGDAATADAGNYAVGASLSGATLAVDYVVDSNLANLNTLIVKKAHLTVTATASGKTYDGTTSETAPTITLSGVLAADTGNVTASGTAVFASATAGSETVNVSGITLAGSAAGNYSVATTATTTATITPLSITGSITAADKTYDGTTAATINTQTLAGVLGSDDVSLSGGTATFDTSDAGTGKTVTDTGLVLTGAQAADYALGNSTETTTATIKKADATFALGGYGVTYDGAAHTATGTAKGVKGEALSGLDFTATTHTNAVAAQSDAVTFTDVTGNYNNNAALSVTDSIGQASSTTTATGGKFTYDGTTHTGGSGKVTGAGIVTGSPVLTYSGDQVDAGSYTVIATYAGDANHTASSNSATITIGQATAIVSVSGYSTTYDATAHTATATATGVGGVDLSADVNLDATTRTTAGSTLDAWTFTDVSGNYVNTSDTVTDVILKADATVTVTGYTGTYDTHDHGATGTVVGVIGDLSAAGSTLDLGDTFSDAPGGTNDWTFTGGPNYNDQVGSVTTTITPAPTHITISFTAPRAYNGTPYKAIVRLFGASGDPSTFTVSYVGTGSTVYDSSDAPIDAGTYVVIANYTGDVNHLASSATALFTITQEFSMLRFRGDTFTYDGSTHTGGSVLLQGKGNPTGSAVITYTGDQIDAGTYLLTATYAGDANNTASSGSISITINQATSTTTVVDAGGTYNGSPFSATSALAVGDGGLSDTNLDHFTFSYVGTGSTAYDASATAPINAGTYAVTATYNGDQNHFGSSSSVVPFTIAKAASMVTATGGSFVYDGTSQTGGSVIVTGAGIINANAATLSYSGDQIDAGTYTVTASYAGDDNHTASTDSSAPITITQASSKTIATGGSFTYDGTTHTGGSGKVTGAGGLSTGATFLTYSSNADGSGTADQIDAGTYYVTAHYAGDANHAASDSAPVAIVIGKADAIVSVSGYGVTYDSAAHTANGAASGVEATPANLNNLLHLDATTHTGATGNAVTDGWTFDGNGNYKSASGTVSDAIAQRDLFVTANANSKTYGQAISETGSIVGVQGSDGITAGFASLGDAAAAPVGTGSYAITAALTDPNAKLANYAVHETDATLKVNQATAGIVVTPYTSATTTYDAASHTASGTASGVSNANLNADLTLSGTTHTDAGTYAGDAWSFHDAAGNYADASGTVTDSIAQAHSATTVIVSGATYDGNAHGGTASVTGIGGLNQGVTVIYTGVNGTTYAASTTAPTNAGNYTASASYGGDTDHASSSDSQPFTIAKAASMTTTLGHAAFTYSGLAQVGGSGMVSGAGSLSASATSLTYSANADGTGAADQTDAGIYYVTAHYAGDANHTASDGTPVAITIAKADATVAVTGYTGGTYDGNPHTQTVTVTGVGSDGMLYTTGLSGTNAIAYSQDWSFTNNNYNSSGERGTLAFKINKAYATIAVTPYNLTYDGAAHAASGSASGVGGLSLSGELQLTATTHTNAGTYNGDAWTFSGDSNYNAANGTVNDAIAKASSMTTATGATFTYDGTMHTGGSGKVTGAGTVTGTPVLTYSGDQIDAGSYTVTATYAGDANHTGSSNSATISIGKATTATTTIGAGPFTYTNTLHSGGSGTVSGAGVITGSATLSYSGNQTDAGTYYVTAHYAGDTNHIASDGLAVPVTINQAHLTVAANANSKTYGQTASDTGTVTGVQTGDTIKAIFFSPADAATADAGTYAISANLTGSKLANEYIVDTNLSNVGTFIVNRGGTTTTVVSSVPGGSYYGQTVAFTATVAPQLPGGVTPSGTVQFYINGQLVGSASLQTNGKAVWTTSSLGLGANTISVIYSGNGNYLTSTNSTPLAQSSTAGILLLDTTGKGALTDSGNGKIIVQGGSIVVDSTNAAAVVISGNASVQASLIDVAGGDTISGNGGISGAVQTGQGKVSDALINLAVPDPMALATQSTSALSVGGNQTVTLQPGVYVGGISLGGNAKVTLSPGVYYMKGGGFNVSGNASVTDLGKGVLIYNAPVKSTDAISFSGNGNVQLSAMTTGTWAGITLFQARTSTVTMTVSGNGNLNVTGMIYAAAATLNISGNAGVDNNGTVLDTFGTSLILFDLLVSGNGILVV